MYTMDRNDRTKESKGSTNKKKSRGKHRCLSLVFVVCCVETGFCDGPISHPGKFY